MATFRKLPSGSWQAQVRRKGEPIINHTFHTKALAEQWARSIESQIDHGIYVDRSEAETTTLGELIDRYLLEITPTKKGIKQETYRLQALKKALGHLVLASIQSKHIAAYRDSRINAGLSGTTVLHELSYLSTLFDVAMKDWGIPLHTNPASMVRKPPKGRGRDRRLTKGELALLLYSLNESTEVKVIVQLAIETSMRRSELLSMQWVNIDMVNRFVVLPDTKNGESRAVPLSKRALQILEGLQQQCLEASPRITAGTVFSIKPDSVRTCTSPSELLPVGGGGDTQS